MSKTKKVIITLVGLDGNAYALMGVWKRAAQKQGWSPEEIKVVLDAAMSGDYNNLLNTLSEHSTEEEDES